MIKYYLSWDCATKSLAYAYVGINTNINDELYEHYKIIMGESYKCKMSSLLTTEYDKVTAKINGMIQTMDRLEEIKAWYAQLRHILTNFINIIDLNVIDLAPGINNKDIPDHKRILLLKQYLNSLDDKFGTIDKVLIEHQPTKIGAGRKTNVPSSIVSHCICYHYSKYNPQFVNPTLKNKVYFADNLKLTSVGKTVNYATRKLHSKLNLLYYLKKTDRTQLLSGIPTKNYDDAADAFMQILGHIMYSNDQ